MAEAPTSADREPPWTVSADGDFWLARIRLNEALVPVGYCGTRELAEAMATGLANQLRTRRERHDWLTEAYDAAAAALDSGGQPASIHPA